ncbi:MULTISPECIES: class I SAM-dependent methyltransferase [Dickeya]|nr:MULTISPECIES: class I SAM-dependent methyltransferase [Dickeya]
MATATKMPQSPTLLHDVTHYWDNRAAGYNQVNMAELHSDKRRVWQQLILQHAPDNPRLTVLDIGTGPGFFAVTLALAGHEVTAVDATPAMLAQARRNAGHHGVAVRFCCADVQALPFADNSFDLLVSRNVTWNLSQPQAAYQAWHRVLKPGGRLLNFDANWYAHLFSQTAREAYWRDRQRAHAMNIADHYANTDTVAMENIARTLPLGREIRPQWDIQALRACGFRHIETQNDISERVWDDEEKINYASTPMFMIVAEK